MTILAYIIDGFQHLSTTVKVQCADVNGTSIKIYRGLTQIGSGTSTSGIANITVSELHLGDVIIAYVGEYGARTGGPVSVVQSIILKTGFKTPKTVQLPDGSTETYEAYLASGGQELADVYDPSHCLGNTPDSEAFISLGSQPISFDTFVIEQDNLVIVQVKNIQGVKGSPLIKFDSDAIGSATTKNYTADQTVSVIVYDSADITRLKENIFDITVQVVVTPPGSAIWNQSYGLTTGTSQGNILSLLCNCFSQPQMKMDGYSEGSTEWFDGASNNGVTWGRNFFGVTFSNVTIRWRVKSNPLDTISMTAIFY